MKCSRCHVELGTVEDTTVCQDCGAIVSKITFINCTPHTINELTTNTSFPSFHNARCEVKEEMDRLWNDIPINRVSYGQVTGLPEPEDRTIYIVSLLVKQACPERDDLVCPGELKRDENGQPIGCLGFRF